MYIQLRNLIGFPCFVETIYRSKRVFFFFFDLFLFLFFFLHLDDNFSLKIEEINTAHQSLNDTFISLCIMEDNLRYCLHLGRDFLLIIPL